ncbi:hypothetical protein [Bacillus cereus]|uniref:hypothetical protein n=1 Tax=Bacillus cereus TaxID=1396 RepID=UPI001F0AE10F|nr:hypothetical protein [Bacillus cereus]
MALLSISLSTNLENKQLVPRFIEILSQKKDEEILSYKRESKEFSLKENGGISNEYQE